MPIEIGDVVHVEGKPYNVTCRWDVTWGKTRRQRADDYIASGEAKRRKDGAWDMRYTASRFVADVESGKPSLFA